MSRSRQTKLTSLGLTLLAKAQAGATLHFTRVVMGEGTIAEDTDTTKMLDVVSAKLELPISNVNVTGTGTATLETQLQNNNLKHGFFAKEVGIFAKINDEEEVLYAYRNTGDDSEYIPAGGGSELWNITYNVVTVVHNAENITATISGDTVYVSYGSFVNHRDSENPHPNVVQKGEEVSTTEYLLAGSAESGNKLNRISLENARKQILAGDIANLALMTSRIEQLEAEQAAIALKMEAENSLPDANMLLAENFETSASVDQLEVQVVSCAAGDDSVDVASNYGIIIGSHYWITDSVHAEYVQVKSVIKNGDTQRILLTKNLEYTYDIPNTKIYRTTCWILNGIAHGSGDILGQIYNPSLVWKGTGKTDLTVTKLATNQSNADNFNYGNDIIFSAGGLISVN